MTLTSGWALVILGSFLLAGYLAHVTAPKISVPRVTILLLIGALASPSVFNLVPAEVSRWFPFVAHIALAMVGFLLGERFVVSEVQAQGREVLVISAGETLLTALLVLVALLVIGAPPALAMVMAGIAPASAPAAIFETVREGRAKGPLTRTLLGVVAIDDAWGVILFSVLLVIAETVGGSAAAWVHLWGGLWEVVGALLLGGIIALPMSYATTRVREGEPTLVEAMGFVLLTAGIATVLNVSYLLSAMALGAGVANMSPDIRRPFRAVDGVSEPFFAIFFLLAGFRLELHTLATLGFVGAVYVAVRMLGLVSGGFLSGALVGADEQVSKRIGFCILPQAGVALGFALLVQERLPEIGSSVLNLVIATTVLFEITGPLIARRQLKKAGELDRASTEAS
ncbi:MAG: sodium:proton exchanger [Gammaproteobacteria bacterium]|nr:sodium:proton exchanger [Gammaproteobacteria bacterium]NIR83967.1 sodium:proton exchanger [Gammaproteobacteria bacterium]NIR89111.1 sodium:proton exchanger [Gammaproteobacteria bacterium]NIU04913.1 sodium:proton exchanger [Gammaproteobacteria bacterium]NIV52079.1 sodium:proton exchanger [Gammaproteobacteria bacterium]